MSTLYQANSGADIPGCHLVGWALPTKWSGHYNRLMVLHVDAIFSQGAFRPLEPLALAEGTRVHLSVEEKANTTSAPSAPKIQTPKLAHPQDAPDFVMEVREGGNGKL
jgi:predicted DNA-binding antitoxin AbrB/MazE fold protein